MRGSGFHWILENEFRKPEVVLNSERKYNPVLFPCACRSPHSDTYPHHSFRGTFVLGRRHRVEQIDCCRRAQNNVKVEWHQFVPFQGSFQISDKTFREEHSAHQRRSLHAKEEGITCNPTYSVVMVQLSSFLGLSNITTEPSVSYSTPKRDQSDRLSFLLKESGIFRVRSLSRQ